MNKTILTLSIILISTFTKAQWSDSGTILSTLDNVEIKGATDASLLTVIENNSSTRRRVNIGASNSEVYIQHLYGTSSVPFNFKVSGSNVMTLYGQYVGIGTTSPSEKLDVSNGSITGYSSNDAFIKIKRKQGKPSIKGVFDGTSGYDGHVIIDAGRTSDAVFLNHYISSNVYMVNGGGRVGIGTSSPSDKLHVDNGSIFGHNSSDAFIKIKRRQGQPSIKGVFDNTSGYDGHIIIDAGRSSDAVYLNNYTSSNAYFVTGGGNVGIGTTSVGSHRLAVEGSIGAREIKVESSGWSDFVFDDDYELRSLEEVEAHIAENGHLPEIPSEVEVTENGINLGEMDALLLQKIEELTLYMIELNKQMAQLKKENTVLKNEISILKKE